MDHGGERAVESGRSADEVTASTDMTDTLRDLTRRHFFRQAGFGIGSLALASLIDERLLASAGMPHAARDGRQRRGGRGGAHDRTSLRPEGEADHLPVHGRRAVADRHVRSQAEAAAARRPADPGRHRQGRTVRVHQGHAAAARLAVHVPEARAVSGGDVDAAAAPREARRRDRDRPLDDAPRSSTTRPARSS